MEGDENMKDWYVGSFRDDYTYTQMVNRAGIDAFPPVIVTCAVTGGVHGAEANPNLPELPDDQVQQIYDAYNAGAAMVHIHARVPEDPKTMSQNYEHYLYINQKVREKCPDIIINNTAMGGRGLHPTQGEGPLSLASLPAKPEVASLDLTQMRYLSKRKARKAPLFGRDQDEIVPVAYGIRVDEALEALETFDKFGAKPEYELFGPDDIKMMQQVVAQYKGAAPHWVSMLFGGAGTFPSISLMMEAANLLPPDSVFNVIGIGAAQMQMATAGIILGHHIRVGLEDNVYYKKGVLAESNAQMVERAVSIATAIGRPIATPAQAREMLGLGAPRQY